MRIPGCDFRRNGDLARELFLLAGLARKREHVGRLVLSTETTVQGFHFGTRRYQNVERTRQSRGMAGATQEAIERQLGEICNALLEDDQLPTVTVILDWYPHQNISVNWACAARRTAAKTQIAEPVAPLASFRARTTVVPPVAPCARRRRE